MSASMIAVRIERRSEEMELVSLLEGARSQIEQRFLDGGAVLLSVLDVLNRLLSVLETLTTSLDEDTAHATIGRLADTATQLTALPATEALRQERLSSVAETEKSLGGYIADMLETLRYLRTFATTAKITGAGIPDFAGFAEEIIARIQAGATQVNTLSGQITALDNTIQLATADGGETLERFQKSVPSIASNLSRNAADLTAQHRRLADLAERVGKLARAVQTKVGTTLSAMQIGDITRQRIEHCQAAFTLLEDYLASPEATALDRDARTRLTAIVRQLVFDQLREIAADFDRDCATVVKTILGFNTDITGLLGLHQEMETAEGGGAGSAMRTLEADVSAARAVVHVIEQMADRANELGRATVATVRELLDGVETIKLMRTDIQYMALNTNLRCSKLGEEGRAIGVVTAELRFFSGMLDDTAQKILTALHSLEADATKLSETDSPSADEGSLDTRLEEALDRIRNAGDRMERDMDALRACSQDVSTKAATSVTRLDFKADLGDVLVECANRAGDLVDSGGLDTIGLEASLADLGPRIAKAYTMTSEREIHARIFGTATDMPTAGPAASDDDLFEDALF
ncbi:chemotaxis protein [Rhizobium sp. Root482]|uniref:chemotaxis protein n=1 Tax=Rhizobium sp. Root482 TaxID=1736543 RepID=UPI0012E3F56D|nr:chemotaxis protein [Rhizobium sp. Root482]